MHHNIKLLGAKTGQGHISALKAIEEIFIEYGYDVVSYPSFYEDASISNEVLSDFNNMLSMKSIDLSIQLNELFALEGPQINDRKYQSYLKHFYSVLTDHNQIILSFTPLINKYVLKFLKENAIFSRYYIIITDPYKPMYPGFEAKGADAYLCPSSLSQQQLIKSGINENDTYLTGFPLRKSFLDTNIDKSKIYEIYKLPDNKKIVLVSCGAYGSPSYISLTKELLIKTNEQYHYVIVCGNNKTIRAILDNFIHSNCLSNCTVLEYVQNMHELLSVSTYCITKAGANMIHECIACRVLPLIVGFWGLQYQERGVFDYLKKYYDLHFQFNDVNELINYLSLSPDESFIAEKQKKLDKARLDGAEKIVKKVLNDIQEDAYANKRNQCIKL